MSAEHARKILVTGGLGFIGYHLGERLSREAATELVLVDNLARGRIDADAEVLLAKPNVRFVQADLADPAVWSTFGQGYDEVYHFAAVVGVSNVIQRPEVVLRVNALSVVYLLDWFSSGGGERLLFPSTSEAYAWTQQFHPLLVPTPEDVPLAISDVANPRASYAGSKIFGELAVTHACGRAGKRFAILRYHNVYGPRMGTQHVIPELHHRAAFEKQNPLVVFSPDHSRAFCYVDDAVEATIRALRVEQAANQTFNIGNDREEVAVADLAARVLEIAGIDAKVVGRPAANDPIARRCPDISRARSVLAYEPEVDLHDGLRRTIAWYERYYRQQS